jgi:hypothetical protein
MDYDAWLQSGPGGPLDDAAYEAAERANLLAVLEMERLDRTAYGFEPFDWELELLA